MRIQAPIPVRIRRLLEVPGIGDPGLAEQAETKNDNLQQKFIKMVYGQDWDTAKAFDLVIDTGKIPPGLAAEMVVQATRELKVRERAVSASSPICPWTRTCPKRWRGS